MSNSVEVEITIQDIAGVRTAISERADRIELCTALNVAGLTPSIGLVEGAVEIARSSGNVGFVDVLIRPREGDFVYDSDEIATAVRDIRRVVAAGVDGVVIGAATRDRKLDRRAVEQLVSASDGATFTFHRAFDIFEDQFTALEQLVDLGFVRVLTSGAASTCFEGLDELKKLSDHAAGRIQVMAGGGVRIGDIPDLVAAGVDAIHLSARQAVIGGPNRPGERSSYFRTDPDLVRAAVLAVKQPRSIAQ